MPFADTGSPMTNSASAMNSASADVAAAIAALRRVRVGETTVRSEKIMILA